MSTVEKINSDFVVKFVIVCLWSVAMSMSSVKGGGVAKEYKFNIKEGRGDKDE